MSFNCLLSTLSSFFFFTDTAPTEIYTLSLHDALPISAADRSGRDGVPAVRARPGEPEQRRDDRQRREEPGRGRPRRRGERSEEHTSEPQSRLHLVCRLLLEKKKKKQHVL